MNALSIFEKILSRKNEFTNQFSNNFKKAFLELIEDEGIYSWYSSDSGGETIFGIARNYYETWSGFLTLDQIKKDLNLSDNDLIDNRKNMRKLDQFLLQNSEKYLDIFKRAIEFYYIFWKKYRLDELGELGIKVFNTGVNQGFKTSIKNLQITLNLLNRNQKDFLDLVVDGIIGNKTINAYKILKSQNIEDIVKTVFELYKGKKYIELMEKNREKYSKFRGWFRRVCKK